MCELIFEERIKSARKNHTCMACYWILEMGTRDLSGLKFSEYRSLVTAKREGWKILKGQPYIRQRSKDGSDIFTFKARPEIHAICLKYDFYPEC